MKVSIRFSKYFNNYLISIKQCLELDLYFGTISEVTYTTILAEAR